VTTDGNRWSHAGQPTIYLAGDPGVALAELGRHWREREGEVQIWGMRLALRAVVDLRAGAVRAQLGLPADLTWVLDAERCQSVAQRLRSSERYDGLIVPSAAFLDDASSWNAVVFVERVRPSLSLVVDSVKSCIRIES